MGAISIGYCVPLTYLLYFIFVLGCGFFVFWVMFGLVFCFVLLCFSALSYVVALQNASGLSCIFLAPVLESVASLMGFGSFHWRMALETEIWVLGVLIANWDVVASRSS